MLGSINCNIDAFKCIEPRIQGLSPKRDDHDNILVSILVAILFTRISIAYYESC
jgi:hypothetical protein